MAFASPEIENTNVLEPVSPGGVKVLSVWPLPSWMASAGGGYASWDVPPASAELPSMAGLVLEQAAGIKATNPGDSVPATILVLVMTLLHDPSFMVTSK